MPDELAMDRKGRRVYRLGQSMRTWYKVMAVMMALLWLPVSAHCLLETAELIHHDACCQPALGDAHDHGHGGDGSCQVESRQMAGQKQEILKGFVFAAVFIFWETPLAEEIPLFQIVADGVAPPELRPSWQFASRAAVSPRAPSILL